MEGFQRELRRHITQYDAIQGSEWNKITNHIIRKYHGKTHPLQHGIQNARHNWSCKDINKIWMDIHSPLMDQQHTPQSNHTQYLAQTRN
jgi:hypothetical protein